MILDEAQNIKNSSSARWKTLLGFQCRNRLLLTGTPIQNSMQGTFNRSYHDIIVYSHTYRTLGTASLHHAQLVRLP